MANHDFEKQLAELLDDIAKCANAELVQRTKALIGEALIRGQVDVTSGQEQHATSWRVTSIVDTDNDVRRLTNVSALAVAAMGFVAVIALLAHR